MKKVPKISAEEAASLVKDGDVILGGGFGMTGNPVNIIHELAKTSTKDLTFIANNVGEPNMGGGRLLNNGQLKKMIGSFFTSNREAVLAAQEGRVEYELLPQGTLAEAIRAGGAGIPAFFTATGYGTEVADGKETREINGRMYVLEEALHADFALVKAWKGDTMGNLIFKGTARNFNPMMAKAGKITIAEVEELVEPGVLDPNHVHVPGIYIQRIFQGTDYEKRIEQRTVSK